MYNTLDNKITEREKEVLAYIIKGFSNTEISEKMCISVHTVKAHLDSLYKKLKVHNKVQATISAVTNGFIDLDDAS